MAKIYTKGVWVDEVLVATPKYQVKDDLGVEVYGEAEIALATDVTVAGTPVTADMMNNIEEGIDALDTKVDTFVPATSTPTASNIPISDGSGKLDKNWLNPQLVIEDTKSDNYQLVLTDAGKLITLTGAVAKAVTIPLNSTIAFPVGTTIAFSQDGTGALSLVAEGGVTIRKEVGLVLNAQYAMAAIVKISTNVWRLTGSLKA